MLINSLWGLILPQCTQTSNHHAVHLNHLQIHWLTMPPRGWKTKNTFALNDHMMRQVFFLIALFFSFLPAPPPRAFHCDPSAAACPNLSPKPLRRRVGKLSSQSCDGAGGSTHATDHRGDQPRSPHWVLTDVFRKCKGRHTGEHTSRRTRQ